MTSAISVDGLVRRFDGVTAVDHVNLDVQQGEIYGFLGPNGAAMALCLAALPGRTRRG
jgi:ABC-2 type transport system ATP-binding protein